MKKKKILKIVLPICFTLCIVLIIFLGIKIFTKEPQKTFLEKLEPTNYGEITNYAIYGIHMNIEGKFTLQDGESNPLLVLSNGDVEIEVPWIITKEEDTYSFKTSDYINEGINLESLPVETLYLVLKTESKDEKEQIISKYYSFENHSIYDNLEYYTLTKNNQNNLIKMEWNTYEECPTWRFKIENTKLPNDVYDITIDPGHDGTDPGKVVCVRENNVYDPDLYGNCYNGGTEIEEREVNLNVSLALKEKLESLGYKVTLTRMDNESRVEIYDPMGSATMANDTKSKFNFAIHHNSSGVNGGFSYLKGLELYIANDTNLDFANIIVEEIITKANTQASLKEQYKIANGIYQRFFTQQEVDNDDYPGTKSTKLIYYYYIREVGGVSTHAINNGYSSYPANAHYNSNNTAEPYLFELGYMDNLSDINNIKNNPQNYAEAISSALQKYLAQE